MPTQKATLRTRRNVTLLGLGTLCLMASFGMGIRTSGEVESIATLQARDALAVSGDVTGDGEVDREDAIAVLEIVEGYAEATPRQMNADPDRDGHLTVKDALTILHLSE